MHDDARIRGITAVYATGSAFETLLGLKYHSLILTMGIIGVAIYSIESGGVTYLILMLEICMVTEGTCELLEIKSMHKLVQYFQSLYWNEDIYELKGVHIVNFEVDLFSSSVEYCSISNVNSYQCSCKQCCAIAVYAMCYSVLYNKVSNSCILFGPYL